MSTPTPPAPEQAEGLVTDPSRTGSIEALPLPAREPNERPPEDLSMVIGTSGQKYASGHADEEYHDDLSNREEAVEKYDQMVKGNALVAGPLARIEAQLRQADWEFKPAPRVEPPPSYAELREKHELDEDDVKTADIEHEAVQLHSSWLLGGPAREYAMETSWLQQALHEACLYMAFPSSVFEVVWRRVHGRFGTKLVPQRLCWIHPRSIKAFKIDEAGRLLGIAQESQHGWDDAQDSSYGGGKQKYHRAFIPARKLLILSRNREGTLPEGTPFTRHMYADAERASHAIRWQMVDSQNRAVGIPFVEIPKGVGGRVVESAKKQARRMTYGNQHLAYVVAPEGIKVGFVDMSANTVNMDAVIKAQERRMRHVTNTEFTALGGESGSGALALAKVLREEFNVVVQGVAAALIEDIQRGLIERVHRVNYGDRIAPPHLEAHGLLAVDPQDLASLVEKKVIPADRDVANVARRTIGLGPLPPDSGGGLDTSQLNDLAIAKAAVMTGDAINAIHVKLGLPELSPDLTEKYNQNPINAPAPAPAMGGALPEPTASFSAAPSATKVTKAQRKRIAELKDQRKALVEEMSARLGELRAKIVRSVAKKATPSTAGTRLGGRLTPSKQERARFRQALRSMADELLEHGRRSMLDEGALVAKASKVRVDFASKPLEVPEGGGLPPRIVEELDLITELNADQILDAIEPLLRKLYWRSRSGGVAPDEALEQAVEEASTTGVRMLSDALTEAAGVATNAGRSVGLGELMHAFDDEGLDLATVTRVHLPGPGAHCAPCRSLEGRVISVDSDDYDRYEPPKHCEGRERCHCAYMLDLPDEEG